MTDKIPRYIQRDAKKLYKFWKKTFTEEHKAINKNFGASYSRENGKEFLEVDGGMPEIVRFGRKYLEIVSEMTGKLRDYAGKIGFQDYNGAMNKGQNISSWKKDGWIVSIPDNPESLSTLEFEKDVSEK